MQEDGYVEEESGKRDGSDFNLPARDVGWKSIAERILSPTRWLFKRLASAGQFGGYHGRASVSRLMEDIRDRLSE